MALKASAAHTHPTAHTHTHPRGEQEVFNYGMSFLLLISRNYGHFSANNFVRLQRNERDTKNLERNKCTKKKNVPSTKYFSGLDARCVAFSAREVFVRFLLSLRMENKFDD